MLSKPETSLVPHRLGTGKLDFPVGGEVKISSTMASKSKCFKVEEGLNATDPWSGNGYTT